jgi:hypothetical protein
MRQLGHDDLPAEEERRAVEVEREALSAAGREGCISIERMNGPTGLVRLPISWNSSLRPRRQVVSVVKDAIAMTIGNQPPCSTLVALAEKKATSTSSRPPSRGAASQGLQRQARMSPTSRRSKPAACRRLNITAAILVHRRPDESRRQDQPILPPPSWSLTNRQDPAREHHYPNVDAGVVH